MRRMFETVDPDFIKYVLKNMYNDLVYDDSPSLEEFVPTGKWFILVDGSDLAGIINVLPLNNVMYSCHIFIFEPYRGSGTEEWGIAVADYMKKNYGATTLLAITPYTAAKNYAERMGMKQIAVLPKSIKKNGKLLDQYMLLLGEDESC